MCFDRARVAIFMEQTFGQTGEHSNEWIVLVVQILMCVGQPFKAQLQELSL